MQYIWEFELRGIFHKIEFYESKISGKKKLSIDGEAINENPNSEAISTYSFQLDSYNFNIVKLKGGKYDIKVNDIFFNNIIESEKSKKSGKSKKQDNPDKQGGGEQ